MTQPPVWNPSANPGASNRQLVRNIVAAWLNAQRVPDLLHVYASVPAFWNYDEWPHTASGFGALAAVAIPSDSEAISALVGPNDFGGSSVTHGVRVRIAHTSYELDSAQDSGASEDSYDAIYDAVKDALRGPGRALGRPDVILGAGQWPKAAAKTGTHDDPVIVGGGSLMRYGVLQFSVTQYLPQYPATA